MLAALSALALASGAVGCSKRSDDVTETQSALTVPVPPITQFAVLASRNASFDDRTRVTGGSVGVASTSTNTLTAGFDTHIGEGQVVLSPRVVLKDRAATGEIGTNSFTPGVNNVTGPVSAYVAPPTQPTPGTITAGSTPVSVPINGSRTLAAGSYGAVLVDNNGTLNLSGGLYQFASLTVNAASHLNVLASTTVRVSGNVTGLDRSTFLPSSGNASGFRLIVGGATNAVTLGNDVQMKALVVARGDVTAGARYIFSGAISGRDVTIGHDSVLTFGPGTGFQCATNAHCDDGNTCTTDACGDALCTHTTLPNNTACNDGNACTQTDRCASGACVGSNPVSCVALDQCHVPGVCAPATGLCSNPNKTNGTTCSDGNACTGPDACSAGVCVGAKIVNCGACALPDSDEDGVNDCTDKCPEGSAQDQSRDLRLRRHRDRHRRRRRARLHRRSVQRRSAPAEARTVRRLRTILRGGRHALHRRPLQRQLHLRRRRPVRQRQPVPAAAVDGLQGDPVPRQDLLVLPRPARVAGCARRLQDPAGAARRD